MAATRTASPSGTHAATGQRNFAYRIPLTTPPKATMISPNHWSSRGEGFLLIWTRGICSRTLVEFEFRQIFIDFLLRRGGLLFFEEHEPFQDQRVHVRR